MTALYNPLEPDHVRLLRFTDSTGLHANISEHSVRDAPPYACLSYVWGEEDGLLDTDDTPYVVVNGHPSRVQRNLLEALATLGKVVVSENLHFWVDRICINQSDLDERAKQVKLMKLLYEEAKRVLAWTGAANAETDFLACRMLSTIGSFSRQLLNMTRTRPTLDWLLRLIRASPEFHEASTELILKSWAAMIALLKRPYWARTWIH
ncbi:hypothetical protein DOTSEDRAFT_129687 [Dothistroma septosporum NZE10]|uniref:Heterokaryon incompatibility domain-containing protein n=1 Tax=Dothistroma septosporum (strain NZE10 / CBS 128990) TaxID=675120 RepID=N1PQ01_DOTSN|nr:hypothetical protein DOTSEDRAFT_129687 [Dothistroma septosporum NZE10]